MSKFVGACVVLLVCASGAMATPELEIRDPVFAGGVFQFDVVVTDIAEATASDILGFGMGVTLNGSATANLSVDLAANIKTTADWATEVSPKAYAWTALNNSTQCGNSGGVTGLTEISLLDDTLVGTSLANDVLIARVFYGWDGGGAGGTVTIHISGETGNPDPYFHGGASGSFLPIVCTVTNNDLTVPVPEPASLSLLGLGLAGLMVRRFRRR